MSSRSHRDRVLLAQEDRLAGRAGPRAEPRGLELHERDEAVHLGLAGHEPGQDAPEAQGLLAQLRAEPLLPRRGGVALVEHEVDDLEHRGQARRELVALGHRERHALGGERALGPHDPLGDRRLGHEERAGDLRGLQAGDGAQGEGHAGLRGQRRVAAGEHEGDHVVLDRLAEPGVGRRGHRRAAQRQVARELLVALLEAPGAPEPVDRPVPAGGRQPRARVLGDARPRPRLERGDERVLREVLRDADVADDAREGGDDAGRLDPPDRVDPAADVLRVDRHRAPGPSRAATPTGTPRRSPRARRSGAPRSSRRRASARASPTRSPRRASRPG